MTISRKKLLNGLRDHELFAQRDWKLVPLSAEEILENRLDGRDDTARVVKTDRPMPPVLTSEEMKLFGRSLDRVHNVTGHKRFLQKMESWGRFRDWEPDQQWEAGMEQRRALSYHRIRSRVDDACFYGLQYHQSYVYIIDLNLQRLEVKLQLQGYLAHPNFNRKQAACEVILPITPSGRIVPRVVWTDHKNPEKLEKLLFSKRNWKLGPMGKITKHPGMPNELTEEEAPHTWGALRSAETSKRSRYIAFLQSLDIPKVRRLQEYHAWVERKAANKMMSLCGYVLRHRGWDMFVAPTDISLLEQGRETCSATVQVKSYSLSCELDTRGRLKSLELVDKMARGR